jgi:drug/metabolite transporter (DMT)-like permease
MGPNLARPAAPCKRSRTGTRRTTRYLARPVPQLAQNDASVRSKVTLALVAVYLIWGSTYLALRFALESFPPFLLGGARYTTAGLVMFVVARRQGIARPTRGEWARALLLGGLLFGIGNGLVSVAEHTISSGVAAVVVATTAPWSVLFAAIWGARPTRMELLGLCLGLSGVALLHAGGAFAGSLLGFVAIVIAPIGWALGAVLSGRLRQPPGAMGAAVQMMAGGVLMLGIGLIADERVRAITLPACLAFLYLLAFGSFVAFASFRYLVLHARPALASSYAFVNPVVALLLGAWILDEALTVMHLYACLLTGAAVICVLRARKT